MPDCAPLKLLVVDDHAAFRAAVRQVVEDLSVLVIEAASGEEAVTRYAAERPDWVLMDLRMPGMGGLKAAQAIRELAPDARVVVMSQVQGPEYAEQARSAGATDFLNKEDLIRLRAILDPRSAD